MEVVIVLIFIVSFMSLWELIDIKHLLSQILKASERPPLFEEPAAGAVQEYTNLTKEELGQ